MNASQGFIGKSVVRREDHRFLTGNGQYTDDISLERMTYAVFVRSPHAHAVIKGIDASKALKAPGVVAVYTYADIADYGPVPCLVPFSAPLETAVLAGKPWLPPDVAKRIRFR